MGFYNQKLRSHHSSMHKVTKPTVLLFSHEKNFITCVTDIQPKFFKINLHRLSFSKLGIYYKSKYFKIKPIKISQC